MKEWVRWLVLDICWIVITVMNIVKGQKSKNVIIADIAIIGVFTLLVIAQLICDKFGERGKKIMKVLTLITCVMIALMFVLFLEVYQMLIVQNYKKLILFLEYLLSKNVKYIEK